MALVRLRQCLKEYPMSQAALGRKVKKDRRTVHSWVVEDSEPTASDAVAVARELGTTVEYLCGV